MSFFKRGSLLLIIFWILILLTGCWDANEPERMIYVHGLGVDYKDDRYYVYLQIINPSSLAKSEATGGEAHIHVVVGRGDGKTINDAVFDVYRSMSRRIYWGHLAYIIFSENALKKDGAIVGTLEVISRYHETRYNTWIYGTKEPLFDLLKTLPQLEMSVALSRLTDPKATYRQNSLINPITLRELLIKLNEPPHQVQIPYVKLTKKDKWQTDKESTQVVEICGAFFVANNNVKDFIINEINGIRWTNKDATRQEITVNHGPTHVSLLVDQVKVKYKPIIKNGQFIRFQMYVEIISRIREIVKKEPLKKINNKVRKRIENEIKETFVRGLDNDFDIFRLSEKLYRRNVRIWKKIEQNGKIPLNEDSLEVYVKVKIIHGERDRNIPITEKLSD